MSESIVVNAAVLRGIEALPVRVEVSLSSGIPGISIVGSADGTIHESRQRIRCAFRECEFNIPRKLITVNLAPSELKKSGTGLDLPIAIGILVASKQLNQKELEGRLFVGELGLTGNVVEVRGIHAYARLAKELGLELVTALGALEMPLEQSHILGMQRLSDIKHGFKSQLVNKRQNVKNKLFGFTDNDTVLDYVDVIDQELAKRAFTIAAAGHHGLIMMGPPGSGKTMLARRMPSILPPLTEDQRQTCYLIHSVCGQSTDYLEQGIRPYRAPHHSISKGGLLGGGRPIIPGEISLAHNGVLFLDELPEFTKDVLQSLRQPLEDKEIRLVRVDGVYSFPCSFQLIAAANPCPCGYFGDPGHECSCSMQKIMNYQGKIGGPLLDRIDVFVDVRRPSSQQIVGGALGTSSKTMAEQVEKGREYASWRLRSIENPERIKIQELQFESKALRLLESISERMSLGGRAITRLAKVARTIADIDERQQVSSEDVIEASSFRPRLNEGK